jgi:sec-independent protein translocase protein TatA
MLTQWSTGALAITGLPGHWEIVLILLLALLLFGGRKLPELAKGLARSLRVFKSELSDVKDRIEDATDTEGEDEQTAPKDQSTDA